MLGTLLLVLIVGSSGSLAHATSADDGFSEEEVSFQSGDVTLRGTILVPDGEDRYPAIVLVHGAGPGPREQYRQEAEAFVREGIVTLIYDKRTEGYSQFERSYELLAEDALAAVRALKTHPDVDPEAVGLWGMSEGGWVVPIAASCSDDVAFVVLVAATGVPPAQQHAWNLENELRRQGVAGSVVETVSRTQVRVLVGAGLFAEANHDPVEPLERVRQPVLALWGEKDRIEPPAESARILRGALERGGNTHYAIRFFPEAEHGLRSSPDGFVIRENLVPGYSGTVASWVKEVARGAAPGPSVSGPAPRQGFRSSPLTPLAWWESGWVQLGAIVLPFLAFASYLAVAFALAVARRLRGGRYEAPEPTVRRVRRWACLLSSAGLATFLGFVCYFGFLTFTNASVVGPVVAGRPTPWLVLQALTVTACVSTMLLAASWRTSPKALSGVKQARLGLLLAGGVVFAAWAAYWGLLSQ